MVSIEDNNLEGSGYVLKQHIWNAARDTISEWTGQRLVECSLYGVRIYPEGSVLATHVDRLPLGTLRVLIFIYVGKQKLILLVSCSCCCILPVSSAIINVDQDVDEPWYVVQTTKLFWGPVWLVCPSTHFDYSSLLLLRKY